MGNERTQRPEPFKRPVVALSFSLSLSLSLCFCFLAASQETFYSRVLSASVRPVEMRVF